MDVDVDRGKPDDEKGKVAFKTDCVHCMKARKKLNFAEFEAVHCVCCNSCAYKDLLPDAYTNCMEEVSNGYNYCSSVNNIVKRTKEIGQFSWICSSCIDDVKSLRQSAQNGIETADQEPSWLNKFKLFVCNSKHVSVLF